MAGGFILHFFPKSVRLRVLNVFSWYVFDPLPQKHVLLPPIVWGLQWCNLEIIIYIIYIIYHIILLEILIILHSIL